MSLTYNVHSLVATGKPILFWVNRIDPHIVGNEVVAHSGKIAMIKTTVDAYVGKAMVVNFRMATKAYLDIWVGLTSETTPFPTTDLVDYFVTNREVLFRLKEPIQYEGEVIKQLDLDHEMFDDNIYNPNYKKGFDLFKGVLNLVITA